MNTQQTPLSPPTLTQDYLDFPKSFYSSVTPEPLHNARLVIKNDRLLEEIGCSMDDEDLLDITSGQLNRVACQPIAQKYVGHQFGYYNPDLGDGRGVLLGQWVDSTGQHWDFHLKGAGRTPYSRQGDGRAVLRSTLREFLASEALYGLGVPTTRALAVAACDEPVQRETVETRASLIRVTPTHIRFGHFQWAASKGAAHLELLIRFVVHKHFPQWQELSLEEQAAQLLDEACQRTARLLAQWQSVGFNHGVMNTDNMSILGETFDFGPFAFFDDFHAGFVCNHSDYEGRYGYKQQANIGFWNCKVLGASFAGLLDDDRITEIVNGYVDTYNANYIQAMVTKLGFRDVKEGDKDLISHLLEAMDRNRVDYALFFRRMALWQTDQQSELESLWKNRTELENWLAKFKVRFEQASISLTDWQTRIRQANPSVVLRNYIAQEIIEAAEAGDDAPLHTWLEALQTPFEEHPELAAYQQPPKPHQKGFALSCSS